MVESPMAESIEYRPPTQSQNPNMFAVSMPNFETSAAFVETATKCLATAFCISAQSLERPVPRGVRVGHGLQRGEGFRRNDKQRFRRIEIARPLPRNPCHPRSRRNGSHVALAVMLQRLIGHHRTKVRAADADIDDVSNALAGVALPFAAADAIAEIRHLVEHGVDFGHHVFAVHQDGFRPSARATPHAAPRDFP